ncbi:hypothetical protein AMATHDRAFT_57498 [Amanita thiersii Skay4041]|uniref:Uncharacterized protein n=1 Tax=Amanita thiersii Skay4041 TaxID=703135 RepID=A0A2A9NV19_9AGAR|nr:hypothetical protein AMATHDRAFT_57498 [Amanita thiersii Skay4041]
MVDRDIIIGPPPKSRRSAFLPGTPRVVSFKPVPLEKDRKVTQEEQNEEDDEQRRGAMKELVDSWMDRLQLISVITTFFASTEAGMLNTTTRDSNKEETAVLEEATNAAFLGALVLHTFAAIISFLAAFFLINYRLHEARVEEVKAQGLEIIETPRTAEHNQFSGQSIHVQGKRESKTDPVPGPIRVNEQSLDPPIWSTNPHLVQVGPFKTQPPTNLLNRCHLLCVLLAALGFALAMAGIGCFAWSRHPLGASIFTLACLVFCMGGVLGILFIPNCGCNGRTRKLKPRRVNLHP